jgi:hypothetical protein
MITVSGSVSNELKIVIGFKANLGNIGNIMNIITTLELEIWPMRLANIQAHF